jgi:predicted ATPase
MKESKWYVITGAPGSGKTTIISQLSKMGYHTVFEAARILIDEEISKGKKLEVIRKDEIEFQKKVFEMKMEIESKLPKDKIVFLDRGLPDTIAYYQLYKANIQEILKACQEKRYKKIFFLEPLSFEKDYARIEDEKRAKKLSELLKKAYLDLGYEVIIVPKMSVEERTKFILSKL